MKIRRNSIMVFQLILAVLVSAGASAATFTSSLPLSPTELVVPFGETVTVTLPGGLLDPPELPDNEYYGEVSYEYHWSVPDGPSGDGLTATIPSSASGSAGVISSPGNYAVVFSGKATYTIRWMEGDVKHSDGPYEVDLTASEGGRLSIPFRLVGVASLSCEGILSTTASPGTSETLVIPVGYSGGSVTVTAAPTPSGVWPAGKPTWSGASASAQNPAVASLSTATPGRHTVTATCGNSVTLKIIVVELSLSLQNSYFPLVRLNNDDDNANDLKDMEEQNPNDEEIRALYKMEVEPSELPDGNFSLEYHSASFADAPIRIWVAGSGGEKSHVLSGTTWTPQEFQQLQDRTLYIEGIRCSSAENDVSISFSYRRQGRVISDSKSLSVIDLDIRTDANYDGIIDLTDARFEKEKGRVVLLNDDNDNWNTRQANSNPSWNTLADKDENTAVDNENDLVPVEIRVYPQPLSHEVVLECSGSSLDFWDSNQKSTSPCSLPLSSSTVNIPSTLWLEGIAKGNSALTLKISGDSTLKDEVTCHVVRIGVIPDDDRDRKIDNADREAWVSRGPFRFWLNDDEDSGSFSDGDSDLPEAETGWFEFDGRDPNYSDSVVNGRCDLLDFFPVWIDASEIIQEFSETPLISYYLEAPGVNVVFTKLDASEAGNFLTKNVTYCGNQLDQDAFQASVSSESLIAIPDAFVSEIKNGRGVVLCEGSSIGLSSLNFVVKKNDCVVFRRELPISLSEVDAMYRRESLRSFSAPSARQAEPSNMPDCLLGSGEIFFLHGFNVTETEAYAWDSEIFRRLWQSGMTARFNGVTWFGDQGLFNAFNYHGNVYNAFRTANALKTLVNDVCGTGTATVMAHSLGNMVVCSAIKDHGMQIGKYCMLNAAVPSEAFTASNITTDSKDKLRHIDWNAYQERTWCSYWHNFFQTGDDRNRLTWIKRFYNMQANVINYYSDEDEVLALFRDNDIWAGSGAEHWWNLSQYGNNSWHKQEAFKGRGYNNSFAWAGTDWCGWGFDRVSKTINGETTLVRKLNAATANAMTDAQLASNPVFPLNPSGMNASVISLGLQNELLAKGIPALSPPCGAGAACGIGSNTDMTGCKQNGWGRLDASGNKPWLHSDIKNMAFFYTYKLFENLLQ